MWRNERIHAAGNESSVALATGTTASANLIVALDPG
jgi:hypothetical protein